VVDLIVQSVGWEGQANVSFSLPRDDFDRGIELATDLSSHFGCPAPGGSAAVAKLSVTGVGMRSHTGLASRMFQSLAGAGINVNMISTSEVRVNVVVDGPQGEKALALLKKELANLMV